MRKPFSILLLCVAFAMSPLAGCGSSSTAPQDTGPPTFSRLIGGNSTDATLMYGVVATSDGLRVVTGLCSTTLRVSETPTALDATGTSQIYFLAFGQDGTLAWSTIVPGSGATVTIRAMARDSDNNLLVTGTFPDNLTFGTTSLTNPGGKAIFMAKLDATGHPTWVQSAHGTQNDAGLDVAAAPDGTVYVCGSATGEISVAGEDVGTIGKTSGFLVKLLPNGGGTWQQTAVPAEASVCNGVTVSQDGSILVAGGYGNSTVEIGGETLPNDGNTDGFIARFGADGTPMGNIRIGGTGFVAMVRITAIDDEPIVVGTFTGLADFDVNTSAGSDAAVGTDSFIARYTKAGELRWVTTFTGTNEQQITGVSRTSSGEIVACGFFGSILTVGSKSLTASGPLDGFIARLSGSGQLLSLAQISGSNEELAAGIASLGDAAIVVGRTTSTVVTFPDGTQRTPFGGNDSFIYQQP